DEHDGPAVRLALLLRELEQIQRSLDVDVMRGDRRELGPGREERGEVEDTIDLELGEDPLEEAGVGDRSGELARGEPREAALERRDVERDDGGSRGGEPCDEAVTDFAAGPSGQDDRFAQAPILAEWLS